MPAQSRVGDVGVGVCPCHKSPVGYVTVFVSGSALSKSDGLSEVRIGDVGVGSCGHPTVALSGSSTTFADGIGLHRVGDVGANCGPYVSVSGSPKNQVN